MTSKNLFFKLVKQDFQKRIWCPLILFISSFLVLEVPLIMEISDIENNPQRYWYDIPTFVNDYFFGTHASGMAVFVCAAAFLCAFSGFAYMHSKVQVDLYHSLPVSRTQFFWARFVSGILQFFVPFLIHVLICAGIAAGRGAFDGMFSRMLAYIGVELVIFLLAYGTAIAAVCLTGNMIMSILGTAVLFCYSKLLSFLTEILFERFFDTYVSYGSAYGLSKELIWRFSPLSMIVRLFTDPDPAGLAGEQGVFRFDGSYVWVLLLAAVLYSLFAYFLYLRRASEAAGRPIAFGVAEPVIKTLVVVPAALFCGEFFSEMSSGESLGWFIFGLAFGYVLLALLMEVIFRKDIKGVFMHKGQFLFNATCTALIFIVLENDALGYDTYVPADSQLDSCAVSVGGLMNLAPAAYYDAWMGYSYSSPVEYCMYHMEIQEGKSAMELARKAAKEGLSYAEFDYYDGIADAPEFIEAREREEGYREISFGYKLLNGKTVYRIYTIDINDGDTLRLLSDIFGSVEYKLGATPLFNEGWSEEYAVVRCTGMYGQRDIKLTPAMRSELLEIYQSEYMGLALDTVMNVVPLGTVQFLSAEMLEKGDHLASDEMWVYPQFTETIALLKEYGFDMEERITAEDVAYAVVYDNRVDDQGEGTSYDVSIDGAYAYTVETSETTSEKITEYTDKAQIQQILDSIYRREICYSLRRFASYDDNTYKVYLHLEDKDRPVSSYNIRKGEAPDFIELGESYY